MNEAPDHPDPQNYGMRYVPRRLEKLGWRLFPHRHCEAPELPGPCRDCSITRVTVCLSFIDRIRLLLTGRLLVEVKTSTEHEIGESATTSAAYVDAPKFLQ